MAYRYRMHWLTDPMAPLGAGRPLFGQSAAEAVSHASRLWNEAGDASAIGYCVVDTEDDTALWRLERDPPRGLAAGSERLTASHSAGLVG